MASLRPGAQLQRASTIPANSPGPAPGGSAPCLICALATKRAGSSISKKRPCASPGSYTSRSSLFLIEAEDLTEQKATARRRAALIQDEMRRIKDEVGESEAAAWRKHRETQRFGRHASA